ncbi:hypothetical protein JAAARDRAFT_198313 [Jaapia argillacea MUCL 33604]|uniref:Uncharacterized protein n=1 Tax=Jaapia argillacea MUCL 33604 TaxID=933084 RepID=A0A067PCB1_9AGAM|nr:hypothetical protein JAAARDRAFT_198313 [Jaapia argillacea MUCL 33604]
MVELWIDALIVAAQTAGSASISSTADLPSRAPSSPILIHTTSDSEFSDSDSDSPSRCSSPSPPPPAIIKSFGISNKKQGKLGFIVLSHEEAEEQLKKEMQHLRA